MRRLVGFVACFLAVWLCVMATSGAVFAADADSGAAGPEQIVTAALNTAPGTPTTSVGSCTSTAPAQTSVSLSWTESQSAVLDASGGYLVSGYNVGRATSASGAYSTADTVTGAPPATNATDHPSGILSQALVVDGTTAGSDKAYTVSESSLSVTANLAVGTAGTEENAIQITPDGLSAVIAESTAGQVQILTWSGTTWAIVKTIAVTDPTAVAIDPVAGGGLYTAYVVSDRGTTANGVVYPIGLNGASSALGTGITVTEQANPTAILVTPNGSTMYVANYGSHTVDAINTSTSAVTSIALSGTNPAPVALVVTPDSSHVYVADRANSIIDDITTSSNTVTAHVALPAGALDDTILTGTGNPDVMAMLPSGASLYVAEFGTHEIQQVNTALSGTSPDAVAASIPTGGGSEPENLAMSPNGCLVYVADWPSNDIFAIDTWNNAESTAFVASCDTQDPQAMQVTPDNQYLIIPENYSCGNIQILNTTTNTVTTIAASVTGNYPALVAIPPSIYYYEISATHSLWSSTASASAAVTLGWNPGGWQ